MKNKSRFLVLLTMLLLSSTLFVNLSRAYSGYVGEIIYLPAPSVNGTLGGTAWESSDNSLVSVNANGAAQINKYFSGEVTITCQYNYSYVSGGKIHYVTDQFASYSITSKSSTITLNKTEITIEAGDEVELTYTNSSGYDLPYSEWLTSNKNVAKMYGGNAFVATDKVVGEKGVLVIGVGEGQCTISCDGNSGDNVKTCKVTVVDNRWVKADVESGAVKKGTKVTLTCTKKGATIYYTTDGAEPSKSSTQYTSPIEINSDMTLKAKAYLGSEESKTSKWNYVVSSHLEGEIFRAKTIEGVEVRYKVISTGSGIACMVIGGNSMRAIDKNYSGHLTIPEYADDIIVTEIDEGAFSECKLTSVTLPEYPDFAHIFRIHKKAFKYSDVESITIPNKNRVSIGEEAFSNCRSLETINFNHTGIEKISYKAFYACTNIKTINSNLGSLPKLPTDCFDEKVYDNAVLYIPQGKYDIYKSSDWKKFKNIVEKGSQQQQISLSASPTGGEVKKGTVVTLSTDVVGADIYYTLDGSTPSKSSYFYSSSITINESCTLKAKAYKTGYQESEVITANYTISSESDPDPNPTPNPDPTPAPIPNGSIEINAENFPDDNFRKYLLEQDYGKDGVITSEENNKIDVIDVGKKGIATLDGICYFPMLGYLYCDDNQLTSLDVSKNTKLHNLNCSSNPINTLDLSNNRELTRLYAQSNKLKVLDVSNNMSLGELYCLHNEITELDVSQNTNLRILWCSDNPLTSLNVSNNVNLFELVCLDNNLTELDVSKNALLTSLACGKNQLTSLNLSSNSELKKLYCYENQLLSLDVTNNVNLEEIHCYGNKIQGVAMDNMISSLPENKTGEEHKIYVHKTVSDWWIDEWNVCTTNQVVAIKAKGWTPCDRLGNEYEGSDPSGINGALMDNNKDATIFDLSGKLLSKPRKGIIIIGGKKVVIK